MTNAFNSKHETPIGGTEVAERLKGILKAAGVKMLITDARVSAIFPDGSVARYQELYMDTEQ
jgi:hypothetical protein